MLRQASSVQQSCDSAHLGGRLLAAAAATAEEVALLAAAAGAAHPQPGLFHRLRLAAIAYDAIQHCKQPLAARLLLQLMLRFPRRLALLQPCSGRLVLPPLLGAALAFVCAFSSA